VFGFIAIFVLCGDGTCAAAAAEGDTEVGVFRFHHVAQLHIRCHARNHDGFTARFLDTCCHFLAFT